MKMIHIDSSALGDNSVSRALTDAIVRRFGIAVPALEIIRYDLDADPLPHLTAAALAKTDPVLGKRSERVLDDFLAADVVVIGVPMYNFSVPSTLKAWIDRIAIAGKTFRYTADGPEGLAKGKRVILAISQGGLYEPSSANEHQESYLRALFGFLGVTDIEVVRAQGVNLSPQHREQALTAALSVLPDPRRFQLAA